MTVVFVKYKPGYKVTVSGETIGYIDNRKLIEKKIEKYINYKSENIAFREITELPDYEFKLVNRDKKTEEKDIMMAIEEITTTTYKTYAVTFDGEQKAIVVSQEEAESILNDIKQNIDEDIDFKLGIVEVYTTDLEYISKEDATAILNELKVAKITEYKTKKAEEEKKKLEEQKKLANFKRMQSYATTATSPASGNINGMDLSIPVNGSISSRFGSRSSVRSTAHTGLDISAPSGTGIRAISAGTVSSASYRGTYGNLIIIDHGNGVQSYYAHCSDMYVSPGQTVDSSVTIGAVGSTGNSTGPHLHLEIRLNGTPVNPQNYLYNK